MKSDSNHFCFQRQDQKLSALTVAINPDLIDEESEENPKLENIPENSNEENISENLNEENISETLNQEALSENSLDKNISENLTSINQDK